MRQETWQAGRRRGRQVSGRSRLPVLHFPDFRNKFSNYYFIIIGVWVGWGYAAGDGGGEDRRGGRGGLDGERERKYRDRQGGSGHTHATVTHTQPRLATPQPQATGHTHKATPPRHCPPPTAHCRPALPPLPTATVTARLPTASRHGPHNVTITHHFSSFIAHTILLVILIHIIIFYCCHCLSRRHVAHAIFVLNVINTQFKKQMFYQK